MKKIKKKTDKIFFIKFSLYIKIVNTYYQKTKKSFEKRHVKDIKTFLEKKKAKSEKRSETDIKIFLKNKSRNYLCI